MKNLIFIGFYLLPAFCFAQLSDSSVRLVKVQGGLNFRDIGGYKTTDGKEVVWGKLYRSSAINKLTDDDVKLLEEKKIHTVVDFRGREEAAVAPDRLPANTDYTLCPAGSDSIANRKEMFDLIKKGNFLNDFYGEKGLPYFGDRNRSLFVKLLSLNEDESLLYHCTAGRDRTGMATALILYTLGVPQATIEQDFVASNIYLIPMMSQINNASSKELGISKEAIEKELMLRPEHIEIFFNTIKKHYGNIENFLQQEMGIGEKEIKILKAKFTK